MTEKVLFVDDEEHILQSMKRQLRKRFDIHTASSGDLALQELKEQGPFAVIVSDMRMPGMDGIQLLTKVKDLYPDTVRMMLTGNADQETATEAVNKGQIFRFLNKPCPTSTLVTSIALAQRQFRLITAEKDMLEQTLKGSVQVLSELLSIANPVAFSSGYRIKELVNSLADKIDFQEKPHLEISALMSQIGCVTLPSDILNKLYAGIELEAEELEMYLNHPTIGASLIEKIPRLEMVAAMIERQLKDHEQLLQELDDDPDLSEEVCLGANILKIAIDYDLLRFRGILHPKAIKELKDRGSYNPDILKHLIGIKIDDDQDRVVSLNIKDLSIGMVTEENIVAKNGALIAPKGQEVTWPVLQGVKNFAKQVGVQEPILVRLQAT